MLSIGLYLLTRLNLWVNLKKVVLIYYRMIECVDMMNSGWLVSGFLKSLLLVWMKTYRCSDSCSLYTPDVFEPICLTDNTITTQLITDDVSDHQQQQLQQEMQSYHSLLLSKPREMHAMNVSKATICSDLFGTVPNFDSLSRENYKVFWEAELSCPALNVM